MKISRPTQDHINEAFELLRALNFLSSGYNPFQTDENEEPAWLEDGDKSKALDNIIALYDECDIEWLLMALSAVIAPANKVIDLESDTLEVHPEIQKGLQDSRRMDFLEKDFMEFIGLECDFLKPNKTLREAVDAAIGEMAKEAV